MLPCIELLLIYSNILFGRLPLMKSLNNRYVLNITLNGTGTIFRHGVHGNHTLKMLAII